LPVGIVQRGSTARQHLVGTEEPILAIRMFSPRKRLCTPCTKQNAGVELERGQHLEAQSVEHQCHRRGEGIGLANVLQVGDDLGGDWGGLDGQKPLEDGEVEAPFVGLS